MIKLANDLNTLCFYRDCLEDPIFKEFYMMVKDLGQPEPAYNSAKDHYFILKSKLAEYALELETPIAPTAWKNYIITLLTKDNETTRSLENKQRFPFEHTLKNDLEIFSRLYKMDFTPIIERLDINSSDLFDKKIFEADSLLAQALESEDKDRIYNALISYINENGLGEYAGARIFRVDKNFKETGSSILVPIKVRTVKTMDELVGYERQKERLLQNTRSFVNGYGGLNTLLYGDMGTGKSTMVKSLIAYFKDTPLRFIELKKEELKLIPEIYKAVSKTNYPFILFIDDLSFDDGDSTYKDLKNALEGSFEEPPENIIMYATSNKRTLVTQRKSERQDAVNAREILEEKLSLVSRFGLTIPFTVPKQSDYLEIVEFLAKQNNLEYTDEVREEAIQWELRHMNRSGRTAEQFVQYLITGNADYETAESLS